MESFMQQSGQIISCKHLPAVCSKYTPRTVSFQYLRTKELSCHQKWQKPARKCSWGHSVWWNMGWETWSGTFYLLGKIGRGNLCTVEMLVEGADEHPPRGNSTTGHHYRKVIFQKSFSKSFTLHQTFLNQIQAYNHGAGLPDQSDERVQTK